MTMILLNCSDLMTLDFPGIQALVPAFLGALVYTHEFVLLIFFYPSILLSSINFSIQTNLISFVPRIVHNNDFLNSLFLNNNNNTNGTNDANRKTEANTEVQRSVLKILLSIVCLPINLCHVPIISLCYYCYFIIFVVILLLLLLLFSVVLFFSFWKHK